MPASTRICLLLAVCAASGCYGPGDGVCTEGFVRNAQGLCRPPLDAGRDADLGDANDGDASPAEAGNETDADTGEGSTDSGEHSDDDTDAQAPECTDHDQCSAAEPVCGPSGKCKGCVDDEDCTPHDGVAVCAARGACVECVEDLDCLDPDEPVCGADNTCEAGCVQDSQCDKGTDGWSTPACEVDAGTCVSCLPGSQEQTYCPDDGATPGNACDPGTLTCSGEPRGTLKTCGATDFTGEERVVRCVSDSECDEGARCVPTGFQGTEYGQYCLRVASADNCPPRWSTKISEVSVGGVPDTYCAPRANLTTCETVLDFGSNCSEHSDCGHPDVDDGFCDSTTMKCTYRCTQDGDCPTDDCAELDGRFYCDPS